MQKIIHKNKRFIIAKLAEFTYARVRTLKSSFGLLDLSSSAMIIQMVLENINTMKPMMAVWKKIRLIQTIITLMAS